MLRLFHRLIFRLRIPLYENVIQSGARVKGLRGAKGSRGGTAHCSMGACVLFGHLRSFGSFAQPSISILRSGWRVKRGWCTPSPVVGQRASNLTVAKTWTSS